MQQRIKDILKRPYARIFLPEPRSGSVSAFIPDFPGCVTQDDTMEAAVVRLEAAAESWLLVTLDRGQDVPEPSWYCKLPGLADLELDEFE